MVVVTGVEQRLGEWHRGWEGDEEGRWWRSVEAEVGRAMLKANHTQEDKEAVLKKLTRLWISTIFVLTAISRCSKPTD